MRRSLLLPVVAVALTSLVSCKDSNIPSSPGPNGGAADISDAVHTPTSSGNDLASNPYFFWLPPDAPQPDRTQYQAFDPTFRPTVRIVCLKSTDSSVSSCDPNTALATFSLANGGLAINEPTDGSDSLYIANLDFNTTPLALSTPGGAYTTYRIEVLTQALGELGGPYTYGFLDIQVGDNGTEANQLTQPGIMGVTDTQTLPIKFRLEVGALVYELQQNNVKYKDSQLCAIRCSYTLLDPNAVTVATLDNGQGKPVTALYSGIGTVRDFSVLIIDQRDPSPDGNCAPGATLEKDTCYRYVFVGPTFDNGDDFNPNSPARFGVCPDPNGPETDGGTTTDEKWKLFKAELGPDGTFTGFDDFAGTDISDFLQCTVQEPQTALWNGPLGRAAGKLVDLFVKPVAAWHSAGGTINTMSDVFWGLDAELHAVTATSVTGLLSGQTVNDTVQLIAVHADPQEPLPNEPVTFTVTSGDGSLADAAGETGTTLTVNTDANGKAGIDWTVIGDGGTLTASSPLSVTGPVTFTATTTTGGGPALFGVNSSDDGLSIINPSNGKVTHIGTTLDGKNGTKYKAPEALATDAFGTVYAWNNSGSTGSNAGSLLAVDRCTGTAAKLMSNGNGHFLGLAGAGQAGSFFGLDTLTDAVSADGTVSTLQSYGADLQIAGADVDPATGTLYGLEASATGGRSGPRLVTIDRSTGQATVVATVDPGNIGNLGTVGSIVFSPSGALIGSASGGKHGDILFTVDTSTGAVTGWTGMQHGEHAPEGMAFAPACPTS